MYTFTSQIHQEMVLVCLKDMANEVNRADFVLFLSGFYKS